MIDTTAGAQRLDGAIEHARIAAAAANEDRVRCGQPGERLGRGAFHHYEAGHAAMRGVAGDAGRL